VNVGRSDASSGDTIIARKLTNTDCSNNINWSFYDDLSLSVSDTTMDLGVLDPSQVNSDTHTITVTSTAASGYTCTVTEDGNLRNGGDDINDVSGGVVNAGQEEYGLSCTGTDCQLTGDNAISGSPLTVAANVGTVNGSITTMTYEASASSASVGTNYASIVTYVCTGNF
jgi:hypothetical protein